MLVFTKIKSFQAAIDRLDKIVEEKQESFELMELFEELSDLCSCSDKPIVLMIDEIDSTTNNQVFLDFLSQLRAYYIRRDIQSTFQSVILAGVHDIRNLKQKIRADEIYPFLVSRLCKLLDEEVSTDALFGTKSAAWTRNGLVEAVKMLLTEKNTLFESLSEKLTAYPELNEILRSLLFSGKYIAYNFYEPAINIATMFGFVKNQNGVLAVANRIFDTWLYNLYLSSAKLQEQDIYKASLKDKNQFIAS